MRVLRTRWMSPPRTWFTLVAALVTTARAASAGQECAPSTVVDGVDLNADGDTLDWSSAGGAGVKFAIIKATQGTSYTDGSFASSYSALKAAGIVRGAYHFFDPTVSGADQANYFLGVVGTIEPGDLPPTLDIECPTSNDEPDSDDCLGNGTSGDATGAELTTGMNDWITTIVAATGRKPLIYSYGSWFSDLGVDTTGLDSYPLWLADYSGTSCFDVPAPWTSATIWQYSDNVTYSGIGSQDGDHFLGSFAQLTAFASQSGATADAAAPPPVDGGGPASKYAAPSETNGNDALSVVNWPDGHIEVYGVGGSTAYRIDSTLADASNGDTWSTAVSLGGPASCGVASVFWASGSGHTTEVFDGLSNGTTESLEYVSSSSSWTSFSSFGGVGLSHLSTVAYPDSHVEVFALADDGAIWHDVSTSSSWSGWSSMGAISGSFATGASTILWSDGHAEIFATDSSGNAWHDATGTSSPPVWGGWKMIGGGPLSSRPMPARWADGHVQLFARGTSGALYTSDSSGGVYPSFTSLNPSQTIEGEPSVLVYALYGPEIFARDSAGDVIHMWSSSGSWSTWANDLGQVITSDPMAWMRPDGLAEVFGVDGSGHVVKSLHDGPMWSSWATLGTGFDACVGGTKLVDAGVPVAKPDAGGSSSGGHVATDSGTVGIPTPGLHSDAGASGAAARDGASDDAGFGPGSAGGCSCRAAGSDGSPRGALALAGLALVAVRWKRRAPRERAQSRLR